MIRYFKRTFIKAVKSVIYALLYTRLMVLITIHRVRHRRVNPKSIWNFINNILQNFIADLGGIYTTRGPAEKTIKTRVMVIIACFIAGYILICYRLLLVASNDLVVQRSVAREKIGLRYDIVDRNDNLLAVNVPSASLFANPAKVVDPESAVEKLKTVFPDIDKVKILQELKSGKSFVWIKRDITPREQQEIFNLGMPGFEFEHEQKRLYTYGNMISHVVGYVGRDMNGLAGIEGYFDDALSGRNKYILKDSDNKLKLSIDIRLQTILNEEVEKSMKKFRAKGAAGIIIDPNTGEILAMLSKPDFDPHRPTASDQSHLFNVSTLGSYEMGSGMKALTIAIGFDASLIGMNDAYDLTYMRLNGFQVKDDHPKKGWSSVPEIFLHSSNVGVAQIMLEIGKTTLRTYLKKLGLLDKLNLEITECGRPLFQPFSRWTDLSLVTMAYGYGISESPAHLMQAMIPVVNGGMLYPITLLKRPEGKQVQGERVFKEETSKKMRQLMRLVVKEGTGRKAEVPGYYVGGKTGTAFKAVKGGYDKTKRISSFFGILPATNPKFIVLVAFDEPIGTKDTYGFASGGWTAAPTVGAVLKRIAVLYGINSLDPQDPAVMEIDNVPYKINNET